MFAVGGLDDSSCFDTVERYDTLEDQWTPVASMNHRRGGAGLVALEASYKPFHPKYNTLLRLVGDKINKKQYANLASFRQSREIYSV